MPHYEPHSAKTQAVFEQFLREVQRWAPPGLDSLADFADEAIAATRRVATADDESAGAVLHALFSRSVPREALRSMIHLARQLTDYVDGNESDSSGVDDASQEDSSSSDGDRPTSDADDLASHLDDSESDDSEQAALQFSDVATNPNFLVEQLKSMCADRPNAELSALSTKILGFLKDSRTGAATLETQLTACLGAYLSDEMHSWISTVVASRWVVVYGVALSSAGTAADRDRVFRTMADHAKVNADVASLFHDVTGKHVVALQVEKDDDDAGSAVNRIVPQTIDLRALTFADEMSPFRSHKLPLPKAVAFESHIEVVVNPAEIQRTSVERVNLHVLPDWARSAFPENMTSLNRMQSVIFPCAFGSNENMLVCAPTGAGKTNVALLAILQCLGSVYNDRTETFDLSNLKMVYVAPMKALVQEMVETFRARLAHLGVVVAEMSGDTSVSQHQLSETHVIVTTPEKWDVVTRKSMDLGIASQVRLMVIDEVHLLHNDRGAVLESLMARLRMQASRSGSHRVRVVGLSATLPNFEDAASFLNVDRSRGLFHFDSSFREVPLRQVFCQALKRKGLNSAESLNAVAYAKTMEHAHADQVMVFVHSRKDTEYTANFMLQKARFEGRADSILRPGTPAETAVLEALSECEIQGASIRESLRQMLPKGFAIHHAGLSRDERSLVEKLFLERRIRVLVCTSTLAWGVNMPANVVVVKGTQLYSAEKSSMVLLSVLDVLQMFGRAGRVGFGSSLGQACIVTNSGDDMKYYVNALNQQLPIESQFMKRCVDALNAECVLGNVASLQDAVVWLQHTFWYVRLRKNPLLYGAKANSKDPLFLQHLHNVAHTAALLLVGAKCLEYDVATGAMRSTDLGRIASHFYVHIDSVKIYLQNMWEGMHVTDLFRLFAQSHEFCHIAVRPDESLQLQELLACCPIAVKESRYTSAAKVNVLLQCYIASMSLEGLPLMSELVYIKDSAQRITRALYEIALLRGFGKTARLCMQLYLMVLHRQWIVQSPLRQLRGLDIFPSHSLNSVIDATESRKLGWAALRSLPLEDLQEVVKRDRDAELAFRAVRCIPRFEVLVPAARPLSRTVHSLDLDVVPLFDFDDAVCGPGGVGELHCTVETPSGVVLHHEVLPVPRRSVHQARSDGSSGAILQWSICVPIPDPKPCFYFIHLVSSQWIGCEAMVSLDLMNISLPKKGAPLLEVHQLDEQGGDDSGDDARAVGAVLAPHLLGDVAKSLFPFESFSRLQVNVVETLFDESAPDVFVGVPPGMGKTVIAELMVLRCIRDSNSTRKNALLYVTASQQAAARRFDEWDFKFGAQGLKQSVVLLAPYEDDVAFADAEHSRIRHADILIASCESLLPLLRRGGDELSHVGHLVVDHAHLIRDTRWRHFEAVVSRLVSAPYLLSQKQRRPRVLVLSLPVHHSDEVCKWLKVPVCFNYGKSFSRALTELIGCDVNGYHTRFAHAWNTTKRMLREDKRFSCGGGHLVFVPTFSDVTTCARDLVLHRRAKSSNGNNDNAKEPAAEAATSFRESSEFFSADDFEDVQLGRSLEEDGIGWITARTSVADLALLLHVAESLADSAQPLVVFATMEAADRIPAAVFRSSTVCVAERAAPSTTAAEQLGQQLSADCSVSELLWMTSRARFVSAVFCRKSTRWTLHQFLNEPLLLEPSNRSPLDFREIVNAAVAQGTARHMNDVMTLFKSYFLFQHLRGNPAYYGVTEDGKSRHLSQLVGAVVASLAEEPAAPCVAYDKASLLLRPTPLGAAAAYHAVAMDTLVYFRSQNSGILRQPAFASSLPQQPAALLRWILNGAEELFHGDIRQAAAVRHADVPWLQLAARSLLDTVAGVDHLALDYTASSTKVALLMLVRCCRRTKWSQLTATLLGLASTTRSVASALTQLDDDTQRLVPFVTWLLRATVELLPAKDWALIEATMALAARVSSGTWLGDSDALQLPMARAYPDILTACSHICSTSTGIGAAAPSVQSLSSAARRLWSASVAEGDESLRLVARDHFRPQLCSDAQVAHKLSILRSFLVSACAVPTFKSLTGTAAVITAAGTGGDHGTGPTGHCCSIDVEVQAERVCPQGASLPSAVHGFWLHGYNAAKGHQKRYAVRLETIHFPAISAERGTEDGVVQQSITQSKLLFSVDEIEDLDQLDLRLGMALVAMDVRLDTILPLE